MDGYPRKERTRGKERYGRGSIDESQETKGVVVGGCWFNRQGNFLRLGWAALESKLEKEKRRNCDKEKER